MVDDHFQRGCVWTIPFKYEDVYLGAAKVQAGGQGRRISTGRLKPKTRVVILSTSPDYKLVRVVMCRTLVPAELEQAENDPTKVVIEEHEDGGWEAFTTEVDCANPRTVSTMHFQQETSEYHDRIARERMLDIDRAVYSGLQLGKY